MPTPGRLCIENRFPEETIAALDKLGHDVELWRRSRGAWARPAPSCATRRPACCTRVRTAPPRLRAGLVTMIFFEPQSRDRTLFPHDPFKALVMPRPIGWISTMSAQGELNLAPYSYFNGFSSNPPIVGFSSEGEKDSSTLRRWRPASSSGAWPPGHLRDQMNASAASLPRGESEFAHAGLETAPSRLVRPPRVADSPAAFECRVTEMVKLKDLDGRTAAGGWSSAAWSASISTSASCAQGRVDTRRDAADRRGGYDEYSVVERVFSMPRPA